MLQSRKYRDGGLLNLKRKMSVIVEAKVVNAAQSIIVVSNFTARRLKQAFGASKKKIFTIPNGVVLPPLDSLKTRPWKKNGDLFLLTIGRMEPRKGIPVLIESFKALSEKYDNLRLILVGRGMNKAIDLQMLEKVRKRIEIYDHLSNSDLRAIYDACDIYVSASLLEGFGLTVLEAMAAGKPVVAAYSGSVPEFVEDGSSGWLVPPNSPSAICEAVSLLIENQRLRQEIGKYNQEYTTCHFTWTTATAKTVEAYRASA
jgi:glycosyltransferase involved in cell wall biosynthesis